MNTAIRTLTICLAALAIGFCSSTAHAQCGPKWNVGIGTPGAVGGDVMCMCVFDDGLGGGPALYVGGSFTSIGGITANGIAKWDGRNWTALGPVGNVGVTTGIFAASVNAMIVWNDGIGTNLYIGGDFTNAGGVTCMGIARWSGRAFSQFNGPMGPGVSGQVFCFAVHQDVSGPGPQHFLYVGGSFTIPGVANTNNIARWDSEIWAPLGTGCDNQVFTMASFIDNLNRPRLYVGGAFANAGGNPFNHIAMWNGQSSSWLPVGGNANGFWVQAMKVWDDGTGASLYVGGVFTQIGSTLANNVARWDPVNGWFALGNGTTGINGWYTGGLTVFNDGTRESLIATAYFDNAGTGAAAKIAKWDGGAWKPLGTGLNAPGRAVCVFDPGNRGNPTLFVGGAFGIAGGQSAARIARWEPKITPSRCPADLDCDGVVGSIDVSYVLGSWGPCP